VFRDDRHSLAARNQKLERELADRPTLEEHRALLDEVKELRARERSRSIAHALNESQPPSTGYIGPDNATLGGYYLGMFVIVIIALGFCAWLVQGVFC
jgi:hypothetical protein